MANDSLDFVQRGKVSIVRRQYAEAVKICRLGLARAARRCSRAGSCSAWRSPRSAAGTKCWPRCAWRSRPIANAALAWLLKGEALVGKGDYLQAEQTLKRAKELDPSNSKADQLLAEIATARAAGFEGLPAEPTDTKVYPARVTGNTDPELGNVVQPMPMDRGQLVGRAGLRGDPRSQYTDDATEVDPDPSDRVPIPNKAADKPASVLVDFSDGEDTVEDSQIGTETFHKPNGSRTEDSSYEGPATEDYRGAAAAARARRAPRPTTPASSRAAAATSHRRAVRRLDDDAGRDPARAQADGAAPRRRRAAARRDGASEPSIVLETKDLQFTDRAVARGTSRAASRPRSTRGR